LNILKPALNKCVNIEYLFETKTDFIFLIINFTLLNAAFGSPPMEDLTGQAIDNHQS
jgi:hypothetical protein